MATYKNKNVERRGKEWTITMEADLLEEIKKREFLWNWKHPLFMKRNFKKATYEEIAHIMKAKWPLVSFLMTGDNLLRKFGNLRTYFVKEMKKVKGSILNKNPLRSKWVHYDRISFLQDATRVVEDSNYKTDDLTASIIDIEDHFNLECEILNVKTEPSDTAYEDSSISQGKEFERWPSEDENNSITIEYDNSNTSSDKDLARLPPEKRKHSVISEPCSNISSSKEFKRSLDFEKNNSESIRHGERETNLSQIPKENNNSDHLYGMFIASQLQEIKDPMQRDLARMEIQNVIIKYKYGISGTSNGT